MWTAFEIEGEDRYERRKDADRLLELLETELTEDLSRGWIREALYLRG